MSNHDTIPDVISIRTRMSKKVVDYWRDYGGINKAFDYIVKNLDYSQTLPLPPLEDAVCIKVTISDVEYIATRNQYGDKVAWLSPARILTHFADLDIGDMILASNSKVTPRDKVIQAIAEFVVQYPQYTTFCEKIIDMFKDIKDEV